MKQEVALVLGSGGARGVAHIPNITAIPENADYEEKKYSKYVNTIINKLNYFIPKHETDKLGYFSLLNKTTGLMLHQISLMTLEKYQPDILINISRASFGTYDFYKSGKIIELGRSATIEAIDNFKIKNIIK